MIVSRVLEDSFNEGRIQGINEGRIQGINEGKIQGINEGINEERIRAIKKLMNVIINEEGKDKNQAFKLIEKVYPDNIDFNFLEEIYTSLIN